MCGRFSFSPLVKIIEDRFDVKVDPVQHKPRYNCAPSQNLAVITNVKPGEISYFRWGLIPFWAKDKNIGNKMINARAESVSEKPSFRNILKTKRCLVPGDGFFEWKTQADKKKTPYRITLNDGNLFAMAGLWDLWRDESGEPVYSFSIITTTPNRLMENIHNRMPVILNKEEEKLWLSEVSTDRLLSMLKPYPAEKMTAFPVSSLVNSPYNDSPEIIVPLENQLF